MNSSSEWRNQDVEGLASGRIPPVSGCFSRWGGFERVDCSSGWEIRARRGIGLVAGDAPRMTLDRKRILRIRGMLCLR